MGELNEISIGQLAKGIRGVSYKPYQLKDDVSDGSFYLLRSNNIQNGKIALSNIQIVDKCCVKENQKIKRGDIIVCMSNGSRQLVGKSALTDKLEGDYCVGAFCSSFIVKEGANPNFVFQVFQSEKFKQSIDIILSGSAINNLQNKQIEEIKLFLPNVPEEQTRIAEILSTTDEAIAHTEALIAKYQRLKTGLMQDLLTKGIDENGNIRSKATHKFVVKNGIEVPEEWEVDILKNKCNLHNNLRKPIAAIERFQNKGSYPYYGATGIIDYINEYRVEGLFVLIGEDGDHYLKFKSQEMTHLVEGKFNVSNHAHILSGKEYCSTKWIHHFFCHRDITYYLTRQGAGRFKLNKTSLLNLPICIPLPNEQEKIISMIEAFNHNVNNEIDTLSKLNSLKIGLMQDLLSGKVRVNMNNKN